jgi:hypothetical protein
MEVGDLREDSEDPGDASGRGDVGAIDERLSRPALEQPDAAWITERASQRGAWTSEMTRAGALATAGGGRDGQREQGSGERLQNVVSQRTSMK